MSEFCQNCKFFLALDAAPEAPGACRRYPPTIFLQMTPPNLVGKPGMQMLTEFPRVPPQGWCGDWRERPKYRHLHDGPLAKEPWKGGPQ